MNYRNEASERSILARLAKLERAAGIEPGLSKVGDYRRRIERLEKTLQRQDGGRHD